MDSRFEAPRIFNNIQLPRTAYLDAKNPEVRYLGSPHITPSLNESDLKILAPQFYNFKVNKKGEFEGEFNEDMLSNDEKKRKKDCSIKIEVLNIPGILKFTNKTLKYIVGNEGEEAKSLILSRTIKALIDYKETQHASKYIRIQ